MSNTAALALVVASFFPGGFLVFYITKMANDLSHEIVAGVIGGRPASTKYRWIVLYQEWLGYVLASMGACVLAAAVNVQIAIQATDRGVETVAYLAAFFFVVVTIAWSSGAVSELVYYRSVLRQAEAD